MYDMSTDSHLFKTREDLMQSGFRVSGRGLEDDSATRFLPLHEGRLGHQFNHRFASEDGGVLVE